MFFAKRDYQGDIKKRGIGLYLLWGFLFLCSVYLTYLLAKNHFLTIRYVQYGLFFWFAFLLLWLVLLCLGRARKTMAVILVLQLLLSLFSMIQVHAFVKFYNRINRNQVQEEQILQVAVLQDSLISSLGDLQNKSIAYAAFDQQSMMHLTQHWRSEESLHVNWKSLPSPLEAYEKLRTGSADAVLFNQAFLAILEEKYPDFWQELKVIYEYKFKKHHSSLLTVEKNEESSAFNQNSYNIYISGIDTFGELNTVSRSDVNIIMTVNEGTNRILLTTTPRDSYVTIAGQVAGEAAKDKLTHAGLFGVETSLKTLEKLYDISIPYYVRVNFTSFLNIIDVLGGIDVENPVAFNSHHGQGQVFAAGLLHLNAEQALHFVRERYSLQGGDGDRGKNQERVIEAIIKKLSSKEILLNYPLILEKLSASIQTNIPMTKLVDLAAQKLNSGDAFKVESQAVYGYGHMDLPSYLMPMHSLYMTELDADSVQVAREKMAVVLSEK